MCRLKLSAQMAEANFPSERKRLLTVCGSIAGVCIHQSLLIMELRVPFFCRAKMIAPAMMDPATVEIRKGIT